MKTGLAILAIAAAALTAGQALAQTCTPNTANTCLTRFGSDPNAFISRLAPGYGGPVVCDAIPANKVQYDLYVWINSFVYTCTLNQDCTWAATNDPQAYSMFCP